MTTVSIASTGTVIGMSVTGSATTCQGAMKEMVTVRGMFATATGNGTVSETVSAMVGHVLEGRTTKNSLDALAVMRSAGRNVMKLAVIDAVVRRRVVVVAVVVAEEEEEEEEGGVEEGIVTAWAPLKGGLQRRLTLSRCPRGSGRLVAGMCTLLVMNSIPRCKLSKPVSTIACAFHSNADSPW